MISWNFPGNQDGQVKGVADAGIENFNGTELSSLARENCQNSLDAALNDSNPDVLVEFERYFVPSKQIPGIMEYRNILKKCKDFWDRSKSEKAKLFLKDAIKEAEKENTFYSGLVITIQRDFQIHIHNPMIHLILVSMDGMH